MTFLGLVSGNRLKITPKENYGMKKITVLTLCMALAVPSLAMAQEEAAGPNTGAITLSGGFDITTQYMLRGIAREDQGFIIQPWLEINSQLYSGDAIPLVEGVGMKLGIWNSIQDSSPGTQDHGAFYEQDIYAGVTLDLQSDLTAEVVFVYREDPDVGGNWSDEVDITVAYDDSAFWEGTLDIPGFNGLQPHFMVAIETDGASDAGGGNDVYYELGIEPSMTVLESEDWPVTLSVPMVLAFGDNYYEYVNNAGNLDDETFGYFSVGLVASVPLNFVPADMGAWEAHAGVEFLFLGDGAEALNSSVDDTEIIGTVGVSMTY